MLLTLTPSPTIGRQGLARRAAGAVLACGCTLFAALPARGDGGGQSSASLALMAGRGSVSCGRPNRGALAGARVLPAAGEGFVTPAPWRDRGLRFGTAALVGLIERAARKLARAHPGAKVGVADLGEQSGGPVSHHRSHQSGRDVDLIYLARAEDGTPAPVGELMPAFCRDQRATYARAPQWTRLAHPVTFDVPRNWTLIRALITDRAVDVRAVFVWWRIRRWLLAYARQIGEPELMLARAREVLRIPPRGSPHDDHFHLRISCSTRDVQLGRCSDHPAPRRRRGAWHWRVPCPRPVPLGPRLVSRTVSASKAN